MNRGLRAGLLSRRVLAGPWGARLPVSYPPDCGKLQEALSPSRAVASVGMSFAASGSLCLRSGVPWPVMKPSLNWSPVSQMLGGHADSSLVQAGEGAHEGRRLGSLSSHCVFPAVALGLERLQGRRAPGWGVTSLPPPLSHAQDTGAGPHRCPASPAAVSSVSEGPWIHCGGWEHICDTESSPASD